MHTQRIGIGYGALILSFSLSLSSAAALFSAAALSSAVAQQPDKTDKKPAKGRFVELFNGKDLEGWKTEGNWLVEKEGVVAIKPREGEKGWQRYGSYLWLEQPQADFVFYVEYKIPKGGNSGVYVRVKDPDDPVETGIEVQILDSYGQKGKLSHHDCGGIIRTVGPSKNMSKPAGEWNTMVVRCRKHRMQVKLNGEQIVDLRLDESPMKDRPLKGYIGLQDHGLPLWFRNAKLKTLSESDRKD